MTGGAAAYLDNNATTAMSPGAYERMVELIRGPPGNAAALHGLGTAARDALEEARAYFVQHLGGAGQVLFTSGATEANALCLLGALRHPENGCEQLVVSELEHASVHDFAELALEWPVAVCRARPDGTPDLDHLQDLLAGQRSLVSMMHVNNETGVIFPVAEIAAITHRHGGLLHVDAAQSVGKMPLAEVITHPDALTLSAHKFHGPLGVGAIAVLNPQFRLAPVLPGGGQEGGIRSGTVNVPAIAAAAVALDEAAAAPPPGPALRDRLEAFLMDQVPHCLVAGRSAPRLWTTSYVCFPGLLQEDLIEALSCRGVHVGTGAACTSALHESRVLRSMGIPPLYNQGGIRISFALRTPAAALDRFIEAFPEAYAAAMRKSPYQ
ncbi:MAG TPA: cysteine desulfurase family protein [Stellaceae bacterium]|nr:cysteine desulfurase family protein [Stellaceae bacterium]